VFTVGSLKLYQHYFIDFINQFPGHNITQTFIAHTSNVTTTYDDIDKMFSMLKLYFKHIIKNMFISLYDWYGHWGMSVILFTVQIQNNDKIYTINCYCYNN